MSKVKPPRDPSDRRLVDAANEIKKILQRYDIMGVVHLASGNGHGEYVNWLAGPSWSAVKLEKLPDGASALRFKAQAGTAPAEERLRERLKLSKSVNALVILSNVAREQSVTLDYFVEHLRKHIDWDESEGVHTPFRETPT